MKDNKSKISCKRGFTLLELLVVMLIIGILAAVAVPQYQLAVAKSRYASLKQATQSIYEAEQVYYWANGTYATSIDELDIDIDRKSFRCVLTHGKGHTNFTCRNLQMKIGYGIYLRPYNRRQCDVYRDALAIAHSVCKAETGLTVPTSSSVEMSSYVYP